MSKKMLIDATHTEETRVVVVEDGRLEELDVETSTKKQIKGNIYLAKVVRVEPSLQAAFVEYGGNRHGFLAFSEIHPDYYQIPTEDLERLKKEMNQAEKEQVENMPTAQNNQKQSNDVETVAEADADDVYQFRHAALRKYRIQEVIHHGQIMLVQVVKEERGNKGAAMTTYLSLAGRYSVLMPKNAHSFGVSRKIADVADRKRLKKIVEDLPVLEGQSVIIRTAGQGRTKAEIKRDFDYLSATWETIVSKTMSSIAPALIHEEGNLIKRTLRDGLTEDVEEVIIEGDEAYKNAKAFLKLLMPRWVKKVKEYKKDVPLFQAFNIEQQMEEMNQKNVTLRSGGYLVIDQTEALVAIDVNSGRATRERNIEETALKTNLEAAEEVARQLRLRDLAGLVVIDFIDMEEPKNNYAVERKMKEALKKDRARIQMGKITGLGLMEISRQRLRSSFLETGHHVCPMCQGTGIVRSLPSCAMHALHVLENAAQQHQNSKIVMTVPTQIALYVLNNKRANLAQIEEGFSVQIHVEGDQMMIAPTDYRMEYQMLPQKERKGFFARAISNLLPSKKTEEVIAPEETKTIEVAPQPKPNEPVNKKSKEKRKKDRPRHKQHERNVNPLNAPEQPMAEDNTETHFKVVEQENLTDVMPTADVVSPDLQVTENKSAMSEDDKPAKKRAAKKQPQKAAGKKAPKAKTAQKPDNAVAEESTFVVENAIAQNAPDTTAPTAPVETEDKAAPEVVAPTDNGTAEAPKTGWWAQ